MGGIGVRRANPLEHRLRFVDLLDRLDVGDETRLFLHDLGRCGFCRSSIGLQIRRLLVGRVPFSNTQDPHEERSTSMSADRYLYYDDEKFDLYILAPATTLVHFDKG